MTLYNPLTTIKNLRKFDRVYKGKVVQNTDESFAGRIKVSIPELFGEYIEVSEEENSAGILPWIYPRFLGSFRNKFEIPEVGDIVEGTVRNVVDFGAFVDIGIKNDALVHISKITNEYIKHPSEVLKVGQIIKANIINVDLEKKKVSLSLI